MDSVGSVHWYVHAWRVLLVLPAGNMLPWLLPVQSAKGAGSALYFSLPVLPDRHHTTILKAQTWARKVKAMHLSDYLHVCAVSQPSATHMGKRALVAGGNAPSAACCWRRLAALPPGIRHIVLVPTVPVVFPKLPLSEGILQTIDGSRLIKGALQKTGLASHILDRHAAISATCDTHTLAAQCPHVGLAVHAQRMGGGTG